MRNPVCWLIQRRLGAYRDGELGPAARTKTLAHVGHCAACRAELSALDRLHAGLSMAVPEPAEGVWDAFWPQVRTRLLTSPDREPARRPAWAPWRPLLEHPRLALGSAVAAAAMVTLAVLAPWQQSVPLREPTRIAGPVAPPEVSKPVTPTPVVVESVETEAPDSSVMVYTHPDADVTVVWVFGLEPTAI
jgi:anti-sigma factor RsiW